MGHYRRALIERGLVKASNFSRNPNKLGYAYVLTPAGIAEKTMLTGRFLKTKIEEFEVLKYEIEILSRETGAPSVACSRLIALPKPTPKIEPDCSGGL